MRSRVEKFDVLGWTPSGIGRHNGEACVNEADGHKEKATFINRMNGSRRETLEGV